MRHVLTVVGARPQLVKAAVVSRALAQVHVPETLVHTGQHYDESLSGRFFAELDIPEPELNLCIGSLSHGAQTGRMLEALEGVIRERKPSAVLVYGDTNSTLAGSLAASKLHVPIAHVEAGLRSFNRAMPEEINRVLTDHLSTWLFTPTEAACRNLLAEGIGASAVHLVGDVMYDAALQFGELVPTDLLDRLGLCRGGYVLSTIHRAENTDSLDRLTAILAGLAEVSSEIPVVLPLHPRTRAVLDQTPSLARLAECLRLIEPAGYQEMLALERGAAVIATDSGGVQKEAFFARVPCVTLRDETEWVELVEAGWNQLCPPSDGSEIARTISLAAGQRGDEIELYGAGEASARIATMLSEACA